MRKRPSTPGERLVAGYLRQRRWRRQYEATIVGSGKRPDFRVEHATGPFIMEVYEPDVPVPAQSGPVDPYRGLANAFRGNKRKQIQAVKAAGLPYVAVVAATNVVLGIEPMYLVGAMFGEVAFAFPVSFETGTGDVEAGRLVFGAGGRLQPELNRGVSAVALPCLFNPTWWRLGEALDADVADVDHKLLPGLDDDGLVRFLGERIESGMKIERGLTESGIYQPSAARVRMSLFHNPYAAHPLPRTLFRGLHDEQWDRVVSGGSVRYERVWRGRLASRVPRQVD